ncbi:MAG: nucleotidyltransferase domain-containing protein [Muribaculaceae bacterium]|nr:nucleotidyltransferase domain-containing protein [Muribaculaceae bacterium]
MDKRTALDSVREFKKAILHLFPEAKTYLFGSYAKDLQNENSDIDVAVIMPRLSANYLWEESPILWRISGNINSLIEPVLLEMNEDTPLYNEVMATGILIE